MSSFEAPKIGQKVKVELDVSEYSKTSLVWKPPTLTITGVVVASEDFNNPRTFRLRASHHTTGYPIIPLQKVIRLEFFGQEVTSDTIAISQEQEKVAAAFVEAALPKQVDKPNDPNAPVKLSDTAYQVKGSKGDLYTVSRIRDRWMCNCIAGAYGKNCSHSKKVELFCKP